MARHLASFGPHKPVCIAYRWFSMWASRWHRTTIARSDTTRAIVLTVPRLAHPMLKASIASKHAIPAMMAFRPSSAGLALGWRYAP